MIRLLALLCVLLVTVVAAEATYRPGADGHGGQGQAAAGRLALQATKQPAHAAGTSNQWLTVLLARPLFAPDRKPVAGSMPADPGMPRLTGIIASADAAVAIFQPAGDAKPVVARHGETVGGWEVMTIAADAVNLRKENDVIVLSPRFDGSQRDGVALQEAKKPRWEAAAPTGLLRARWSSPQLQP